MGRQLVAEQNVLLVVAFVCMGVHLWAGRGGELRSADAHCGAWAVAAEVAELLVAKKALGILAAEVGPCVYSRRAIRGRQTCMICVRN